MPERTTNGLSCKSHRYRNCSLLTSCWLRSADDPEPSAGQSSSPRVRQLRPPGSILKRGKRAVSYVDRKTYCVTLS